MKAPPEAGTGAGAPAPKWVARGIRGVGGWVLPLVAVCGGILYAFLPGFSSLLGPGVPLDTKTPPSDRGTWISLNRRALGAALSGEKVGLETLGRMMDWNRNKRFGIDLRGIRLAEVLRTLKGPPGQGDLLEYLGAGGPARLDRFVSLRHSDISGTEHPGVPLRGLDMTDAKVDAPTIEAWGRALGGRGLMGVNLSGVPLSGVNLDGCHLGGANLSYTGVTIKADARFPGKFNSTKLLGLDLTVDPMPGVSLKKCDLRMTAISPSQLAEVGRSLGGGGLRGVTFPSVDMVFENLTGVGLQFCDLSRANFGRKQLRQAGSSWGGTGLYGSSLKQPDGR